MLKKGKLAIYSMAIALLALSAPAMAAKNLTFSCCGVTI